MTHIEAVAGVLRNDGSGWYAINDAGHHPINIDSVSNDANFIKVDYSSLDVNRVVTFVVTPDETLARLGFVAGASVGFDASYIALSQNRAYSDYVSWTTSQGWVSANGVFVPTYDPLNGTLTLQHPTIPGPCFNVNVTGRGALVAGVGSVGYASVAVQWRDYAGSIIKPPSVLQQAFVSHGASGPLSPELVTTRVFPNSNLWFYGELEVND